MATRKLNSIHDRSVEFRDGDVLSCALADFSVTLHTRPPRWPKNLTFDRSPSMTSNRAKSRCPGQPHACRENKPLGSSERVARQYLQLLFKILSVVLVMITFGCGTTRERMATDQLLMSDAVDRCVAHIDFSPLGNTKVFLDTQYVRSVKSGSVVNSEYIISSLRQQMLQAGCLLQDTRDEADIIVEARVGTLGQDAHDINYGLPANNTLQTAAELVGNTPPVPAMPDVSLAKRSEESAAAKIAVFAYRRESKEPVWQSGLSVARSTAKNKWVMGAGPFQSGEIYSGTHFAGERLKKKSLFSKTYPPSVESEQAFRSAAVFDEEIRKKLRNQILGHTSNSANIADSKPPPEGVPENAAPIDAEKGSPNVVNASHEEAAEPEAASKGE